MEKARRHFDLLGTLSLNVEGWHGSRGWRLAPGAWG